MTCFFSLSARATFLWRDIQASAGLILKKYSFPTQPVHKKTTMEKCGCLCACHPENAGRSEAGACRRGSGGRKQKKLVGGVDLHRAREKPKPLRKQQLTCDVVYGKFIRWCLEWNSLTLFWCFAISRWQQISFVRIALKNGSRCLKKLTGMCSACSSKVRASKSHLHVNTRVASNRL